MVRVLASLMGATVALCCPAAAAAATASGSDNLSASFSGINPSGDATLSGTTSTAITFTGAAVTGSTTVANAPVHVRYQADYMRHVNLNGQDACSHITGTVDRTVSWNLFPEETDTNFFSGVSSFGFAAVPTDASELEVPGFQAADCQSGASQGTTSVDRDLFCDQSVHGAPVTGGRAQQHRTFTSGSGASCDQTVDLTLSGALELGPLVKAPKKLSVTSLRKFGFAYDYGCFPGGCRFKATLVASAADTRRLHLHSTTLGSRSDRFPDTEFDGPASVVHDHLVISKTAHKALGRHPGTIHATFKWTASVGNLVSRSGKQKAVLR
jgi:hypothetical protein